MTFEELYVMLKALRDEKETQRLFWESKRCFGHEMCHCDGYIECADAILGLISAETSRIRESRLSVKGASDV